MIDTQEDEIRKAMKRHDTWRWDSDCIGATASARAAPIGGGAWPADYRPPFSVTGPVLVAEIAERVGRVTALREPGAILRLRLINRIRTIQGTLAIEGSGLSTAQVTTILEAGGCSYRRGAFKRPAMRWRPTTTLPLVCRAVSQTCWRPMSC